MNREQQERLIEKIEYNIKSDMIAQEEKNKWAEKYNDLGQDFGQLKHKEQECNKYKQTLDDIEKIAQDIANTKEWINCTYNALKAESILKIINKAKE